MRHEPLKAFAEDLIGMTVREVNQLAEVLRTEYRITTPEGDLRRARYYPREIIGPHCRLSARGQCQKAQAKRDRKAAAKAAQQQRSNPR